MPISTCPLREAACGILVDVEGGQVRSIRGDPDDPFSRGSFDRWRSRVRQLPEFGGDPPVATLADEIETSGAGQVRALLTMAATLCSPHPTVADSTAPSAHSSRRPGVEMEVDGGSVRAAHRATHPAAHGHAARGHD